MRGLGSSCVRYGCSPAAPVDVVRPTGGRNSRLLLSLGLLALGALPAPAPAQAATNFEIVGGIALPPPPSRASSGILYYVTEPWIQGNYAFVAGGDDGTIRVVDVTNRSAPWLRCTIDLNPIDDQTDVQDVVVMGRWVYAGVVDAGSPTGGVWVIDILDAAAPDCAAVPPRILNPPVTANGLFLHSIGGVTYLFAAAPDPGPQKGVHIFDLTAPGLPVRVGLWQQPTIQCNPLSWFCAPSTVSVRSYPTAPPAELMFVATLNDGVYIVNVSTPAAPATLAHFTYRWTAADRDGDTLADACDAWGDGELADGPDRDPGELQLCATGRAVPLLLDGGFYIGTTDWAHCGGHLLLWSLPDILSQCNPLCDPISVPGPVSEHYVTSQLPLGSAELLEMEPFAFVAWTEEGPRALDLSQPAEPKEIGHRDTLDPGTDSCLDNGIDGATCSFSNPDLVPWNGGLWGAYGLAVDACYVYVTDRGTHDNNQGLGEVGTPGKLEILRYTGGPGPNQPLRVSKDPILPGTDLRVSWGQVPFAAAFNLYRGTFAAFQTPQHYDHAWLGPTHCGLVSNETQVGDQAPSQPNYYYILTAENSCDMLEGNFGYASNGTPRPSALDLGNPFCP